MLPSIDEATNNLVRLSDNTYPGRGVSAGLHKSERYLVQATCIMGRSFNSRNRVYKQEGGRVYTDLHQPDPKADTALIIYNAMDEKGGFYVASNGDQTDTVIEGANTGFIASLLKRSYEPDAPNYTPRITAIFWRGANKEPVLTMSRICKLEHVDTSSPPHHEHFYYSRAKTNLVPGVGWTLQTYVGDGNPLPSYRGHPYPLQLMCGDIDDIAHRLFGALNEENRVAVAVKFVPVSGGRSQVYIINKNK